MVNDYDDSCEDFSKIKKILSLRVNCFKKFFYLLFSIFTLGIFNLIVVWFPKIKLTLFYSLCKIEHATHFAIFGMDGNFYISNAVEFTLPEVSDSHLKKFCIFNVVGSKIKLFEFKLFKYIYLSQDQTFVSLKFSIKTSLENIHKYFTVGLNDDEQSHQRTIFGECDLAFNIDSVWKLIFKEVADPFYLFQVFSICLWFWEDYWKYSTVIVVTTIISLAISVYETRVNLLNVQKMAKYSCEINVIRVDEVK